MAKLYIYSTMSADNSYVEHSELPNGLHKKTAKLIIAGKANVTNPKTLITPKGMMTTVEDSEFEEFEENPMLKRHIERGFITVSKTKNDADSVSKDMTAKDAAAPLTPANIK